MLQEMSTQPLSQQIIAVAEARAKKGDPNGPPTLFHGWSDVIILHNPDKMGLCIAPGPVKKIHRGMVQALLSDNEKYQSESCPVCWTMHTWLAAVYPIQELRPKPPTKRQSTAQRKPKSRGETMDLLSWMGAN